MYSSLVTSNKMIGNGLRLPQGKFRLDTTRSFLTERVLNTGTGCLCKWLNPHPWRRQEEAEMLRDVVW